MQVTVSVDGIADVVQKLREVGADLHAVLPEAARNAMTKTVEPRIKELALVQAGDYRDSWSTEAGVDGGDVVAKTGTHLLVDSPGKPGSKDFPLGIYLEYGTGIYAEDGTGRKDAWSYIGSDGEWHTTSGMSPRPHVRPAYDETRDSVGPALREELEKALGGIAK